MNPRRCPAAGSLFFFGPWRCRVAGSLFFVNPRRCQGAGTLFSLNSKRCRVTGSLFFMNPRRCRVAGSLFFSNPRGCPVAGSLFFICQRRCRVAGSLFFTNPSLFFMNSRRCRVAGRWVTDSSAGTGLFGTRVLLKLAQRRFDEGGVVEILAVAEFAERVEYDQLDIDLGGRYETVDGHRQAFFSTRARICAISSGGDVSVYSPRATAARPCSKRKRR
jgi:hypothetical protein